MDFVLHSGDQTQRVGSLADGAADDDIVRSIGECLPHIHNKFLIVLLVHDRPDAGDNDKEFLPQFVPQPGCLQARGNDSVAAQF